MSNAIKDISVRNMFLFIPFSHSLRFPDGRSGRMWHNFFFSGICSSVDSLPSPCINRFFLFFFCALLCLGLILCADVVDLVGSKKSRSRVPDWVHRSDASF